VVCTGHCTDDAALAALHAGAVGLLRKDTLTPAALNAALDTAVSGAGLVVPDVIGDMIRSATADALAVSRPNTARLTDREQRVLTLIAEGNATREVAQRLSYSERTVKNVVHDVVTKLNARSRSEAVASAVREGLI
jgi:DNA-binding NarL/FixJ family response regulator